MSPIKTHCNLYNNLIQDNKQNIYKDLLQKHLNIEDINNHIFSTAEHAAPFNTKNTLSFLLPQMLLQHFNIVPKKEIVILAASLVPLNNLDFPQGFYKPSDTKETLNIFTNKYRKSVALLNKNISYEDIANKEKENFFDKYNFLKQTFTSIHDTYADQQCKTMENIIEQWNIKSGKITVKPAEKIARDILIDLLKQDDIKISTLLKNIDIFAQETKGVFCSWNETKGTVLFWEVDDNQINKMRLENDKLIGKNLKFKINTHEILTLLEQNKILPNIALTYFILSWLPNIPIAGGHRQYWYWKYMINSYDKIFQTNDKTNLSQFGYNQLMFSELNILPKYGTGLYLANNDIDKEQLFEAIKELPIQKTTYHDGYY
jgi:hypothetical protein